MRCWQSWDELSLPEQRRRLDRGWRIVFVLLGLAMVCMMMVCLIGAYKMITVGRFW